MLAQNLLYQLVTDQGFLQERNIVWETLNNIENDGVFVNGDFQPVVPEPEISPTERQEQIDKDYLIALSLEKEQTKQLQQSEQWDEYKERAGYSELTDEELALKLQKEEDERYEQMQLREQKQMKTMHIQQDPHRAQQPAYPQPESVERSMEHPPQAAVEPNSYHEQSMQMQTNQSYGSVPEDSARTRPSANSSMDSDLSSHSQRAWPDAYPPRHRSSHSKSHKKNVSISNFNTFQN